MPVMTEETTHRRDGDEGPAVVLLHSSAAGPQQWQALARAFKGRRRVTAPHLIGYGDAPAWRAPPRQTVADQAARVLAGLEGVDGPIDFIGHSFGALVALETAAALGDRAGRLVLFEPNPFALLDRVGCEAERAETVALFHHVKACGARGDWPTMAARFTDFFSGTGTWDAMPPERRAALAASLGPNPHEWDAVMDTALRADRWAALPAPVLLLWARDTPAPLRAVARILLGANPRWTGRALERGGHMAPLTRPRAFNAEAERFLAG